jgi:hypothetical protein
VGGSGGIHLHYGFGVVGIVVTEILGHSVGGAELLVSESRVTAEFGHWLDVVGGCYSGASHPSILLSFLLWSTLRQCLHFSQG